MLLLIIAALAAVLLANRKTKIKGTELIWITAGLVLLISLDEYFDGIIVKYRLPLFLLYLKSFILYTTYPLIAILELFLVAEVKNKIVVLFPYIFSTILVTADLFDFHYVYLYDSNYHFGGGPFHIVPIATTVLYTILLLFYSQKILASGDKNKFIIVLFISISSTLTGWLEYQNTITGISTMVAALNILVYYIYLSTIYQTQVQAALYQKSLEFEQSKLTLLMAQIRPHFINNSLAEIEELCYEEPELAAKTIRSFSVYLRNNFTSLEKSSPVPFMSEIDTVKAYLAFEYADKTKCFKVDYDLEYTDFEIPALSVEPLVENAVKHGIDRYDDNARIVIRSYENALSYIIEIKDNGQGFDENYTGGLIGTVEAEVPIPQNTAEVLGITPPASAPVPDNRTTASTSNGNISGDSAQDTSGTPRTGSSKGTGIGMKNAARRLKIMCNGRMELKREDDWTVVRLIIPKKEES